MPKKKKKVQMHFGFITKDFVQSVPLYTQCSILIMGLHKIQISSGVETADCFKGKGRKAGNAEPSQASLSCWHTEGFLCSNSSPFLSVLFILQEVVTGEKMTIHESLTNPITFKCQLFSSHVPLYFLCKCTLIS